MNKSELKSGNNGSSKTQGDWDEHTLAEQIFAELKGTVARSKITEVLKDVIPKYEHARIQIYVPIFIHRDAVKELKSMKASFAAPTIAVNEAEERYEREANSELLASRGVRNGLEKKIGIRSAHWEPAA